MALTAAPGNKAKVTLGANTVLGMGKWSFSGMSVDLLETTSFGDTAKAFVTGLMDYGTATFGGLYDMSNAGAQSTLLSAMINNSQVGDLRFYLNSVSFWSSGAAYVTGVTIGQDKSGLGTIDFTVKFTGSLLFQ